MPEKAAPSLPNIQNSQPDKTKLDGLSATRCKDHYDLHLCITTWWIGS